MPSFMRPIDLEQLQFNQLRTKDLIIAPWNMAQAAQRQIDGEPRPQQMYPQAMAHNKWKTPPSSYDRGYGADVRDVAQIMSRMDELPTPGAPMQPVPFRTLKQGAAPLNRLPPARTVVSVNEPLSRGLLQRGDLDFTNAAELRSVVAFKQDPTVAYDAQTNIAAQMFPSTYVFSKYDRPPFITYPEQQPQPQRVLQGLDPYAPKVVAPLYGARHQPMIVYTERMQEASHLRGLGSVSATAGVSVAGTALNLAWWGCAGYWIYKAGIKNQKVGWPVKAYTIGYPLLGLAAFGLGMTWIATRN